MKTKLPGKLSHYDKMAASAQQFFKEATACREEAARSLDQVDREGWLKLASEWTEPRARGRAGPDFPPGHLIPETYGERCGPLM